MFLKHTKTVDGNFMKVLTRDPGRYRPIVQFLDSVTHGLSELSWQECELIGAKISEANDAGFCSGIRDGMTAALGGDEALLDNDRLRPLVALAQKLNARANEVSEADIEAVRGVGWSDQTVEDVVGLVAIMRLFDILTSGLGFGRTLPDAAFGEMGRMTVEQQGYTTMFDSFVGAA